VLRELHDHPQLELVEGVVLRSMQAAVYRPRNIGHFGLGLPAYAHFTSPIRRYPDLLVHRGLRHLVEHGSPRGFDYSMADMERLGEITSAAERRADEAVWDLQDRLKCDYMQHRVGEEFDGVVTGVVPFGVFVRLAGLHIDGLVHVSALGHEYFRHDPVHRCLVGEASGRTFQLTDTLRVRLTRVNLEDRKIDFELAETPETPPGGSPGRSDRKLARRGRAETPGKGGKGGKGAKKRGGRKAPAADAAQAAAGRGAADPATDEPAAATADGEAPRGPRKRRGSRGKRRRAKT